MSTTEYVVEAVGLVKRRGDFTLGPLDLRVARGFVTGMVGANGSGKTTTLRTLLGLIRADAGSIAIPPMGEVGVAFDQPFVLPYWRIRDAAAVYAASRPGWDQDWFDRLCRRFGLRADPGPVRVVASLLHVIILTVVFLGWAVPDIRTALLSWLGDANLAGLTLAAFAIIGVLAAASAALSARLYAQRDL